MDILHTLSFSPNPTPSERLYREPLTQLIKQPGAIRSSLDTLWAHVSGCEQLARPKALGASNSWATCEQLARGWATHRDVTVGNRTALRDLITWWELTPWGSLCMEMWMGRLAVLSPWQTLRVNGHFCTWFGHCSGSRAGFRSDYGFVTSDHTCTHDGTFAMVYLLWWLSMKGGLILNGNEIAFST